MSVKRILRVSGWEGGSESAPGGSIGWSHTGLKVAAARGLEVGPARKRVLTWRNLAGERVATTIGSTCMTDEIPVAAAFDFGRAIREEVNTYPAAVAANPGGAHFPCAVDAHLDSTIEAADLGPVGGGGGR